jgi:hypothetical protein
MKLHKNVTIFLFHGVFWKHTVTIIFLSDTIVIIILLWQFIMTLFITN